jgi:hypothetical protein
VFKKNYQKKEAKNKKTIEICVTPVCFLFAFCKQKN